MRWHDSATWDDTLVWDDTDTMDAIASSEALTLVEVPEKADTVRLIGTLVPAKMVDYGPVTADAEIASILPPRCFLDKILVIETAGHTGQISGGTSSGGVELFMSVGIAGSDATSINVGKFIETQGSIFLHDGSTDDDWNSMSVDVYFLYWKL